MICAESAVKHHANNQPTGICFCKYTSLGRVPLLLMWKIISLGLQFLSPKFQPTSSKQWRNTGLEVNKMLFMDKLFLQCLVGRLACKHWMLVYWWWWCDWSFERLVTTTSIILSSNKIHNGDILVPANPGSAVKMAVNMENGVYEHAWVALIQLSSMTNSFMVGFCRAVHHRYTSQSIFGFCLVIERGFGLYVVRLQQCATVSRDPENSA